MKMYEGVEVEVRGQLNALAIQPRETVPRTCWTGDWLVCRAGLDTVENRKSLVLAGN